MTFGTTAHAAAGWWTLGRWVVTIALGYLLGSVPVAVLTARRDHVDPRRSGDSNAGFWNVKAQVGWRRSVPVLVGDPIKGALAAAVGGVLVGSVWGAYAGAGAAMLGHAWPVFARFRGGKAVLTWAGAMAVISPPAFAGAILALLVVGALTRSFARGARVGVVVLPVLQLAFTPAVEVAATGALMTFIGLKFGLDAALRRRRLPTG